MSKAASSTASASSAKQSEMAELVAVPYVMTTQPDGHLPDMTGFELERVGSAEGGWYSTCQVKFGRSLTEGETVSACLVNRLDGEMTRVDYLVQAKDKASQLRGFLEQIAAAGKAMTAGSWNHGEFTVYSATPRLWCHADYRAFTTAPFTNNLVQALACNDDYQLPKDQALCLQVRDLKTQHLYEHHVFTPTQSQAGNAWSKALCEQINRDSHLLRAGVLTEGYSAAPADKGNAFWVPQCAELCVTLTEVNWWPGREVSGDVALEKDQVLHAWVYDACSHRLLDHHQWTPTQAQRASGKWLAPWVEALNASSVAAFVRASTSSPGASSSPKASAGAISLWHRGDALRIFTSLPDSANRIEGPLLERAWKETAKNAVLVTVRHPGSRRLLHQALFKPQEAGKPADQAAWLDALAAFLTDQGWPEVHLATASGANKARHLCLPRFSQLLIELENVGDGTAWRAEDYGKYLLATDTWPGKPQPESTKFQVDAGHAGLTIETLGGELEFRLSDDAHYRGYRVAGCVPRASLSADMPVWPMEVTDKKITWRGPITAASYDLIFDYPEKARDAKAFTIGHVGSFQETHFWQSPSAVTFTPPAALALYEVTSLLCEDYGNTSRSEVFDTEGHSETGVDPRTGLFHAHYPVATLQGLLGLGPVCDLTLHYSALRGNEAGLGDGWAWRFSSLETRDRRLTLADGAQIVFTDEQWKELGEGKPFKNKTCLVRSNNDHSEFTITLPSGRQEVLSKPSAQNSDEAEPNQAFHGKVMEALKAIKEKSKPQFPAMPEHWTQWILMLWPFGYFVAAKLDYDEAVKAWEGRKTELDERIAYYQRPFVQLMPSRIVSPYGEALDLLWKRQKGQFLLQTVKSGDDILFSANYFKVPGMNEKSEVHMQIWPTSKDETYHVALKLEKYLLRTLTRVQKERMLQKVDCEYDDDPTLDRVLCRLQELDGSVEWVKYEKQSAKFQDGTPALPRVALHGLIPGSGQQNQLGTYHYYGNYLEPYYPLVTITVETGSHATREKNLQIFDNERQEVVRGFASGGDYWIEFIERLGQATLCYRHSSFGEAFPKAIRGISFKAEPKGETIQDANIRADKNEENFLSSTRVLGRETTVFLTRRVKQRRRIASCIDSLLQSCPAALRGAGKGSIEWVTTVKNADDNLILLNTQDQHFTYRSYYPAAGKNLIKPEGVKNLPELECPEVPEYTPAPLMAEYQCDAYGNSLGLTLYGYRLVTRNMTQRLEVSCQVTIEGIKGAETSKVTMVTGPYEYSLDPTRVKYVTLGAGEKFAFSLENKKHEICQKVNKIIIESEKRLLTTYHGNKVSVAFRSKFGDFTIGSDDPSSCVIYERGQTKFTYFERKQTPNPLSELRETTLSYSLLSEETLWTQVDTKQPILWRQRSTETTLIKPKTDQSAVMQWSAIDTQVTCLGNDKTTVTYRQEFEDNPTKSGIEVRTLCTTEAGTQALSKELRSRYSRRCKRRTEPGVEVHWRYDAANRVIERARYVLPTGCTGIIKDQKPDEIVTTTYSNDGKYADIISTQGDCTRSWLDGLQRVWFTELKHKEGEAYRPLATRSLTGLDDAQALGDWVWDYLPGGQAVVEAAHKDPVSGRQPWLRESDETCSEEPWIEESDETDVEDEKVVSSVQSQIEHGLGEQRLSKRSIRWLSKPDGSHERVEALLEGAVQGLKTSQRFDTEGRLVRYERTLGKETQDYILERDGLGRVIKLTRPDTTTLERTYHGLSNQVTELKVQGKVLATQKVTGPSTLTARTVGSRTYTFGGDGVTLPDSVLLKTTDSADGACYGTEASTLTSLTRKGNVSTLAAGTGPAQGAAPVQTWQHNLTRERLPGRLRLAETTPRRTAQGCHWQSLRGLTVASLRADGHWQRVFQDAAGRLLRTCQDHEDTLYRYSEGGQLQSRLVHALKGLEQWQVLSEYDGLGQETSRTFLHNGAAGFSQQMTWEGDGKLASKTSRQGDKLLRTERFTYDPLDRLQHYACEAVAAAHCPKTAAGVAVKSQAFTWDAFDNLTRCETTGFDGKVAAQTFSYDTAKDYTRMASVELADQAKVQLTWNINGYLERDADKRKLSYNVGGQLSKVDDADGKLLTRYTYDGYQRMAAQYVEKDQSTCELRYDGDQLIGETWFDQAGAVTRQTSVSAGLAEYEGAKVRWLIDDPQVGIAGVVTAGAVELTPLLPFGDGAALANVTSGYNGQRRDPVTGNYHAGNGYRSYDPGLCRYIQPDWLSPFGEGGINDYAHCPDPINQHDPSGAIMLSRWGQDHQLANLQQALRDTQPMPVGGRWRGLALSLMLTILGVGASMLTGGTASMLVFVALTVLSAASFSLEVASVFTADANPELSKALGIASMAVGVLSIGNFAGLFKQGWRLLRNAASAVARAARRAQAGVRLGMRVFANARRFGLSYAYKAWQSTRRASKTVSGAQSAFSRTVRKPMGSEWGELVVDNTVYVEKDLLLRLVSTDKYHALTGWKARLFTSATGSGSIGQAAEVANSLLEMNIYRSTTESIIALANPEREQGFGRGAFHRKPRSVRHRLSTV